MKAPLSVLPKLAFFILFYLRSARSATVPLLRPAALLALALAWTGALEGQVRRRGLDGLAEKSLAQLSHAPSAPLEQVALAQAPGRWKHAETENFIYHFFNSYVATPVSVEAEFYHRIVREDLGQAAAGDSGSRSHIFLFEEPALWREFQSRALLDPWSGGIHQGGSVFLLRDRALKFKGRTLGHEIVHALLHRYVGEVPLWLNEGYAEYASIVGYASYLRARDYAAKPRSDAVDPAHYVPLADLVAADRYPADDAAVNAFYAEAQRLVNFLRRRGREPFVTFLRANAAGEDFESALSKGYGGMFKSVDALEAEFRPYATAGE